MPPSGGRRWPAGAVGGGAATAYELCGRSTELARVDCGFDPVRVCTTRECLGSASESISPVINQHLSIMHSLIHLRAPLSTARFLSTDRPRRPASSASRPALSSRFATSSGSDGGLGGSCAPAKTRDGRVAPAKTCDGRDRMRCTEVSSMKRLMHFDDATLDPLNAT